MSKSLRTHYAALHNQFGTAGLVLSVVAIVLALGGGAYAANHATASKARPAPRQDRQNRPRRPGRRRRSRGAPGAKGENGAPGAPGAPGTPGATVKSVAASGCPAGGYGYEIEGQASNTRL